MYLFLVLCVFYEYLNFAFGLQYFFRWIFYTFIVWMYEKGKLIVRGRGQEKRKLNNKSDLLAISLNNSKSIVKARIQPSSFGGVNQPAKLINKNRMISSCVHKKRNWNEIQRELWSITPTVCLFNCFVKLLIETKYANLHTKNFVSFIVTYHPCEFSHQVHRQRIQR